MLRSKSSLGLILSQCVAIDNVLLSQIWVRVCKSILSVPSILGVCCCLFLMYTICDVMCEVTILAESDSVLHEE